MRSLGDFLPEQAKTCYNGRTREKISLSANWNLRSYHIDKSHLVVFPVSLFYGFVSQLPHEIIELSRACQMNGHNVVLLFEVFFFVCLNMLGLDIWTCSKTSM